MALAQFSEYFVVNIEPLSGNEFALTFKYKDTMMKALKKITACEMRLPGRFTNSDPEDPIMAVKKQFGLLN